MEEATAYLRSSLDRSRKEVSALKGANATLEASGREMKDQLMVMTMRLAMAHGYMAGLGAAARGESGCIAVPMLVVEEVIPGTPWWRQH